MNDFDFLKSVMYLPPPQRERVLYLFARYPKLQISAARLFADKVRLQQTGEATLAEKILTAERETIDDILNQEEDHDGA